jgi:hypothetical protein
MLKNKLLIGVKHLTFLAYVSLNGLMDMVTEQAGFRHVR